MTRGDARIGAGPAAGARTGRVRASRSRGIGAAAAGTALLISLAGASVVGAQETQDTGRDRDVVVTGRKEAPRKRAERFVRQVIATDTGQLARFAEPVCPLILGVPASLAGAIEDRLRRVAADGAVRVAPASCAPNLIAVVAANADGFIKTMRKRHGSVFDQLSDVDLRDAFRSGVVHSWRLIETRDENGVAASGDPPVVRTNAPSAFSEPTQATTVNAVVVLDKSVVLDKTVAQIADYVTMRTLAGARPPRNGMAAEETILTLFDAGAAPPKEATAMDRRLLAGLYAIEPMVNVMAQTHQIARRMTSESASAPPK